MSLICIFAYVCVFLRTSYWLSPCAALLRLSHAACRIAAELTQFTGRADLLYLFAAVWLEVTWPPLCFKFRRGFATLLRRTSLSEDWQCSESWRDAKLGVRAVCAVKDRLKTRGESGSESPSDTTGEVSVARCNSSSLCENGWTDQDRVRGEHSWVPK